MLFLSKADIKKVFTMNDAIKASKEALRIQARAKNNNPVRMNLNIPKFEGNVLCMPAYIQELNIIGVKIVSIFPQNSQFNKSPVLAQMLLMDGNTGETLAILDGTYLTQLRTGALQGAAIDLLAKTDAKIAVLFGIGAQANSQLEAMLTVRNLEEIRIVSRSYDRTQLFVENIRKEFSHMHVNILAAENGNQAIKDADIITTVTNSKIPLFDGSLVKNGAHVNGIGSYTPAMQELPESIICRANKIFFDTSEGVFAEAGDILIPIKNGKKIAEDFNGDLGTILLHGKKGRESSQEITLFKSVGAAVFDVVTAYYIYEKFIMK